VPTPPISDNTTVGVAVYGDPGVEVARRLRAAGLRAYIIGPHLSILESLATESGVIQHGDNLASLCRALGPSPLIWATGAPIQTILMTEQLHELHISDVTVIIDGITYKQDFGTLAARAARLATMHGIRCIAVARDDLTSRIKVAADPVAIGRAARVIEAFFRQ
jgi:hypothetical protein